MLTKREGHWGIFVRFGLGAGNVPNVNDNNKLLPAAIVPILELGIQKFSEPNDLTVDASRIDRKK